MAAIKLLAPLSIDYGQVRTVTSAERKIIELACDIRWYGDHPSLTDWMDWIEALGLAIFATTGETVADLMARMDVKIDRAFARRERESEAMARRLHLPEVPAKNF